MWGQLDDGALPLQPLQPLQPVGIGVLIVRKGIEMKESYESPEIEVIEFDAEDVITTSDQSFPPLCPNETEIGV